jgi:hypothetical protein
MLNFFISTEFLQKELYSLYTVVNHWHKIERNIIEMVISNRSVKASCKLFVELECCSDGPRRDADFTSDEALASLDEEKMMCFIIKCLAALYVIQNKRIEITTSANRKHELVKRKVFERVCSTFINADFVTNRSVIKKTVYQHSPIRARCPMARAGCHYISLLFYLQRVTRGKSVKRMFRHYIRLTQWL